jgi:hypothetical protein
METDSRMSVMHNSYLFFSTSKIKGAIQELLISGNSWLFFPGIPEFDKRGVPEILNNCELLPGYGDPL